VPAGRLYLLISLLCVALLTTGCLARRRVITRAGGSTKQLAVADKQALLERIQKTFAAIQTLNATVDMVPAIGSADKGKITEYKDIRAYILFRKPEDIRIIGLYPVVRAKAFDMVSDGDQFKLYVPAKNRFITGKDELTTPSANKLENLRPQHFLEALLVRPPSEGESPFVINQTDEERAEYIVHIVRRTPDGTVLPVRNVHFDRLNLAITRQIVFEPNGNILTDARYREWQSFEGIPFPKQIEINRPRDEYGVVITIVKLETNQTLPDERFALDQPEGSVLQVLGEKPSEAAAEKNANGR
jgi:outer membrane lipoprotein-sorting protein